MKRYTLFVLIAVLLTLFGGLGNQQAAVDSQPKQPAATATDCPNPFVDISGNIFYASIHDLYCRGVVSGTDASHFSPTTFTTNAQVAKIMALGFNVPPFTRSDGQPTFLDVLPGYWAYYYIESVYGPRCGVAYCNGRFNPNNDDTRGSLMKDIVLTRGYPLTTPTTPTFVDVPPTYFAYVYIETAYAHGIVHGIDATHFGPNLVLRRDQMCQIIEAALLNP